MKSKILFICIALLSTFAIAQSKVGTIDSDYIIRLMPETKIVLKRSQDYGAKLDSSFNIKLEAYKTKVDAYKKNEKTLGALAKQADIKELTELETDIKAYQDNGNKLMQLKKNELMRPLYKKLNDAITIVSKAGKYTQVLTISGNQFAYVDPNFDITELVLKNLGIKIPEAKK
ncbi:MAG: OmpH family outer membrane protein [Polaribacter sp.]|uniref:OmpH family outer membrane protein n=1 Tax=Polaribacter sp. TaxID=1920175 RepID=UPI003264F60C